LRASENPAMQIGAPDEASLVVKGAPPLGFKDILGLAPRFATIYSIILEESYLRISNNSYRV
jgi:hypothetical protein